MILSMWLGMIFVSHRHIQLNCLFFVPLNEGYPVYDSFYILCLKVWLPWVANLKIDSIDAVREQHVIVIS